MGIFHVFLNCTSGTKLRNESHNFIHLSKLAGLSQVFLNKDWMRGLTITVRGENGGERILKLALV